MISWFIPKFLTGVGDGFFFSSLLSLLRTFLSAFHRIGFIAFGYVLPALSSVKAVVHHDVDAYHQWTTHFLILHLYTLILHPLLSFAIHPTLQLAFVMWLSLPRTQGALRIYNKILVPLLDRYEQKVDDRIDEVKGELWRMALRSLMSSGFGAAEQLGVILRLAWSGQKDDHVDRGRDQESGSMEREGGRNNKRDPQHSVQDSLLSIRNTDDMNVNQISGEDEDEEDEAYVKDFIEMLKRGLFVFARTSSLPNTADEQLNDDDNNNNDNDKNNKFRLRVFSYEEDIQSFLISSVESDALENGMAIPVIDVDCIEASGPQGIVFRSLLDGSIMAEIVLSDAQDRETLLDGLAVCLSVLSSSSKRQVDDDDDDDSEVGDEESIEGGLSDVEEVDGEIGDEEAVDGEAGDEGSGGGEVGDERSIRGKLGNVQEVYSENDDEGSVDGEVIDMEANDGEVDEIAVHRDVGDEESIVGQVGDDKAVDRVGDEEAVDGEAGDEGSIEDSVSLFESSSSESDDGSEYLPDDMSCIDEDNDNKSANETQQKTSSINSSFTEKSDNDKIYTDEVELDNAQQEKGGKSTEFQTTSDQNNKVTDRDDEDAKALHREYESDSLASVELDDEDNDVDIKPFSENVENKEAHQNKSSSSSEMKVGERHQSVDIGVTIDDQNVVSGQDGNHGLASAELDDDNDVDIKPLGDNVLEKEAHPKISSSSEMKVNETNQLVDIGVTIDDQNVVSGQDKNQGIKSVEECDPSNNND